MVSVSGLLDGFFRKIKFKKLFSSTEPLVI